MRLCLTADLHGFLPEIPDCDLLVIAGDVCPQWSHDRPITKMWLASDFTSWLDKAAPQIVGVAGNHDFALEDEAFAKSLPWTYLKNEAVTIDGIKFWGSPLSGEFGHGWAFMGSENSLAMNYVKIPGDTDVVISHGPPAGICDWSERGRVNTGSRSLRENLGRVMPALVVTGHIHEGYGMDKLAMSILVVNASHVTINYEPNNKPILIDFKKEPKGWVAIPEEPIFHA